MKKLTEAILTDELLKDLDERLFNCKVSYTKMSYYGGTETLRYIVDDIFRGVFEGRDNVVLVTLENEGLGSNKKEPIVRILSNPNYTVSGEFKNLKDYYKENKDKEPNPFKIIKNWLLYIPIEGNAAPNSNEIEWLKKHVTAIRARVPQKYKRAFETAFPGQPYKLEKNATWAISFHLYFDEVDDMPDSLKRLQNKEGNAVDLERKRMNNTSYIWHLIKDYPEDFHFSDSEPRATIKKEPEVFAVVASEDERVNSNIYHYNEVQLKRLYDNNKLTIFFEGSQKDCDKYVEVVEKEDVAEHGEEAEASGDLLNYIVINKSILK